MEAADVLVLVYARMGADGQPVKAELFAKAGDTYASLLQKVKAAHQNAEWEILDYNSDCRIGQGRMGEQVSHLSTPPACFALQQTTLTVSGARSVFLIILRM